MEYKQILNTLSDLNNTNKLKNITHKLFTKTLNVNYDNFNNLLNSILQIFTLKDINLVSEFKNINLDKKKILYSCNNYYKNDVDVIVNLINLYNKPEFLNSYIDKHVDNCEYDSKGYIEYNNETINNINKIEEWNIIDIINLNKNEDYKNTQFYAILNYEFKYVRLLFENNTGILNWELRILPNENINININKNINKNIKLMIVINYKISSKTNIIKTQINNLINTLRNIDGIVFCL